MKHLIRAVLICLLFSGVAFGGMFDHIPLEEFTAAPRYYALSITPNVTMLPGAE
ncbi:hypothetical protein LCGC14_1773570 [marine sediment metagenome]|uniref:Uncharacterized protein n=1 Tax=marine sediment metagenome TaxID=412755 RepID=A0A0F9GXH0_9ZZZZ